MEKIIITIIVAMIGVLLFFSVKTVEERNAWLQSHCTVMGKISGSSGIGTAVGTNGQVGIVSTYTSGKTGYKCDDGLEYWE